MAQDKRSQIPVQEVMPHEPVYSVSPADDLSSALKLLAGHGLNQVLVLSEGRLMGLLSHPDIICYLQISQEQGVKPKYCSSFILPCLKSRRPLREWMG